MNVLPCSSSASGRVKLATTDSTSSAACQSKCAISCWPNGTIRNWPIEPPALAMPSARLRFSGGNARATTPSITPKVVPLCPSPTSTPAVRYSIAALSA
jgi:hypothetical protein